MIVKNEQDLLPNCLLSIKNAVDEIIIVDTGSTDNTVSIAKNFGAKVYFYQWNDNFSEARNYSLKYATSDWILYIDADEELEQADIPLLRDAINQSVYNGIIVGIYSKMKDTHHKFYRTRVFRRGKAYYKDIIHEQIILEGERLSTGIRIHHYGYDLDEKKMQMKGQRTTQLLKKQIEMDTLNSFAWFNYVRNYRSQEMYEEGVRAGEDAIKVITPEMNLGHYIMIVYETANCYLHRENYRKAKELCNSALSKLADLKITPDNIDIIFTLACIYLKEGSYSEAIDYFKRYLSLLEWYVENMNKNFLMTDTLGYESVAYNGIGCSFGKLGQWQTAITHLQKAISLNPKYLGAYKNLALCYSTIGNDIESINILLKTISEGIADKEVLLKLGDLYIQKGMFENAILYIEMYLKKCPEDKKALLKIARCYEKMGNLEAALVGYKFALEGGNKTE
jgi:glycosyltransferase involved in cell wall biosynthesis